MSYHAPRRRASRPDMFRGGIDRPDAFRFGGGIDRPDFMFAPAFHGLGQLTMDPQTVALLKGCSDNCEKQFGVSSGHPDVLSLSMCFANCNVQYPPTVAMPGGGTITPPAVPGVPGVPPAVGPVPPIMPGVIDPAAPPPSPGTPKPPVTKAGGDDMKMWVIGGVVAVAAVGAFLYLKKK